MLLNSQNKTIAFDLDGTLCTLTNGIYENAVPFSERIRHVNELRMQGNRILIFTARGATTGKNFRALTEMQLKNWGVSYDELLFGKPHFDLLVDDKAVSELQYFAMYDL